MELPINGAHIRRIGKDCGEGVQTSILHPLELKPPIVEGRKTSEVADGIGRRTA